MRRATASGEAAEERPRGYRGVRRRRWGKWVSEIRVPGTRERLWLGSYATPEAAAVAHDTAVYFLRGGGGTGTGGVAAATAGGGGDVAALNFPERAAAAYGGAAAGRLSPRSVQRVASDAGMAADAQIVAARDSTAAPGPAAAWHAHSSAVGHAREGASAGMHDQHAFSHSTSAGREDSVS